MAEKDLYLSLGSNIGDRRENLQEALRRLDRAFGKGYDRVSSFIETEPWGFETEVDAFLNAVVRYRIEMPEDVDSVEFALSLLGKCKAVEREMGRKDDVEFDGYGRRVYHSRVIDIDILLIGDLRIGTESLTVPHPLMWERDFVMTPLKELAPELGDMYM
ncbi:MAG: 2-amino-4-hydroxy-6-hydroxymethyldihydropteridine diphosphokinase [Candidatus Cryptobacteroides sp.]